MLWIYLIGSALVLWIISLIVVAFKGYKENKKYKNILLNNMQKIENIDLYKYESKFNKFTEQYTLFKNQKAIIRNIKGDVLNICPKCNGYLKIVKWKGNPFIGCSNYPNCSFYRKFNRIFEMEI